MQALQAQNQKAGWGYLLGGLVLAAILGLMQMEVIMAAERLSLGEAEVVTVPQFSYEIAEVAFEEPLNISTGAGVTRRLELVQVTVRGERFRPKATGPIIWLNGIPTLRTQVADDGASVGAYFLESLQALENAAARLGRWELLYQPHEGAQEVFRISPSGEPADANSRPTITPLSPAERQRVETLRHQLGIQ